MTSGPRSRIPSAAQPAANGGRRAWKEVLTSPLRSANGRKTKAGHSLRKVPTTPRIGRAWTASSRPSTSLAFWAWLLPSSGTSASLSVAISGSSPAAPCPASCSASRSSRFSSSRAAPTRNSRPAFTARLIWQSLLPGWKRARREQEVRHTRWPRQKNVGAIRLVVMKRARERLLHLRVSCRFIA